jgi:Zn-dependent metalloprotease
MKAPGTAFNDPRFGADPQPSTMSNWVQSTDDDDGDYGGVHTNSGIPNHAFYLIATGLGGHSWEKAGKIWYDTLRDKAMTSTCDFKGFADITVKNAKALFGDDVAAVVTQAWTAVEVYGDGAAAAVDAPAAGS